MAASTTLFDKFKQNVLNGTFNLSSATVKMYLATAAVNPSTVKATAITKADLGTAGVVEVTGTGYTARGATCALAVSNPSSDTITVSCSNTSNQVQWTSSTITASYGIVYVDSGTDSTSNVIAWVDFSGSQTSSSGNFTVTFSSGVFTLA
jgi:hypothetical protein